MQVGNFVGHQTLTSCQRLNITVCYDVAYWFTLTRHAGAPNWARPTCSWKRTSKTGWARISGQTDLALALPQRCSNVWWYDNFTERSARTPPHKLHDSKAQNKTAANQWREIKEVACRICRWKWSRMRSYPRRRQRGVVYFIPSRVHPHLQILLHRDTKISS